MKQCPKCLKVFPPEKSYCPFDGTALRDARDRADYIGYIIDNKYQLEQKIGEGIAGRVAETEQPILIVDGIRDARLSGLKLSPEIGSSIIVPMKAT